MKLESANVIVADEFSDQFIVEQFVLVGTGGFLMGGFLMVTCGECGWTAKAGHMHISDKRGDCAVRLMANHRDDACAPGARHRDEP